MADQQILIGTSDATATVVFTDQDGVPADPTTQPVTVTIVADDGTIILASTDATRTAQGTFEINIPDVGTARLDVLTLIWTAGTRTKTTTAEIVGGYYVDLGDLRALFPNTTKYTTAKLAAGRRWFETEFERYTGRAFVPRYRRITVWGDGSDQIQLPDEYIRRLRSVTVGATTLTTDQVTSLQRLGSGIIRRPAPDPLAGQYPTSPATGWPIALFGVAQPVDVAYECGLDEPPENVRRAGRVAIQAELLTDNAASRELSLQTEIGLVRMSYPGPERPFGIPFVDRVANSWKRGDRDDDNTLTVGSVPIG